jgi:acetyl-CoA carboxylase carboxyltransferase component
VSIGYYLEKTFQQKNLKKHMSIDPNSKSSLDKLNARIEKTLDSSRTEAAEKRHNKGYRTARENLKDLCDANSFIEYGQLAVAAQRKRRNLDDLQTKTAADGVITGELGAMGLKRIGSGKGSKSTESTLR